MNYLNGFLTFLEDIIKSFSNAEKFIIFTIFWIFVICIHMFLYISKKD